MKTEFNLSWEQAGEALEAGKLVARKHWAEQGGAVLCIRPNDRVTEDLVPTIKTLPIALKSYIQRTGKGPVQFDNGYCLYYTDSRVIQNGWQSTKTDRNATDWGIVGE
jgi:hypothetical protein